MNRGKLLAGAAGLIGGAGLGLGLPFAAPSMAQTISQPAGCVAGVDCSAKSITSSSTVIGGNGSSIRFAGDAGFFDEAANTIGLRNGGNSQTLNLYGTYTDASNYERLTEAFDSGGGRFRLFMQRAGMGSVRPIDIGGDANSVYLTTSGAARWQVDNSGHLLAATDNAYDIGASAANRPRNIYAANNVIAANSVVAGPSNLIGWNGRAVLFSPADSTLRISNNAATISADVSVQSNNVFQHGAPDAATAVAQIVQAQSVAAGASNVAGANWTFNGSRGTGTGAGGSIIFQVAPAGSSGSTQNALAAALTIASDKSASFAGGIAAGGQAVSGNAITSGAGFIAQNVSQFFWSSRSALASPSDGTITLFNNSNTGFTALQFGGTTSSFPALKRNSTTLQVRLADDSSYASIQAAQVISQGYIQGGVYSVSTLPTCNSSQDGTRAAVSDATTGMSGNFGTNVIGGGVNHVPVFCDGTNWKVG